MAPVESAESRGRLSGVESEEPSSVLDTDGESVASLTGKYL